MRTARTRCNLLNIASVLLEEVKVRLLLGEQAGMFPSRRSTHGQVLIEGVEGVD